MVNEELLELIRTSRSFLIIGHEKPDGDCIFSCLAFREMLLALGKDSKSIVLANQGPFIKPEISELEHNFISHLPQEFLSQEPLVCILDCADTFRIGSAFADSLKEAKLPRIVIDHHGTRGPMTFQSSYVDPASPSTTILVNGLYKAFGLYPSKQAALYIVQGFLTDTGFFRFLRGDQKGCLTAIADLVDHYALGLDRLYSRFFQQNTRASQEFLFEICKRASWHFDDRLVISWETEEDMQRFADSDRPSDMFYQEFLSVATVKSIAFIKTGEEPGKFVLGFRSSHDSGIDVGAIASTFGGGGHFHASGASCFAKSLEDVISLVKGEYSKYFK
ncbi:MAG: DHH family phosphoesterase [Sphaerochaetaceae bacterium]|jgi:phosphoesterase RecJ-like protein|nr:DHH family phosphoesterase [Sphaerochaetaceae bacterium]